MGNEIRVSPNNGSNVLHVRCFDIGIIHLDHGFEFWVTYKGVRVEVFPTIQDAVEFCRE